MNEAGTRPLREDLHRGQSEVRGIGKETSELAADFAELIRLELELAKSELGQIGSRAARGATWGAIAGGTGFWMAGFLGLAAMFALAIVIPLWAAALVTAAGWGMVALPAAAIAYGRIRQATSKPERTIATLKEDLEWARHLATRSNGSDGNGT